MGKTAKIMEIEAEKKKQVAMLEVNSQLIRSEYSGKNYKQIQPSTRTHCRIAAKAETECLQTGVSTAKIPRSRGMPANKLRADILSKEREIASLRGIESPQI